MQPFDGGVFDSRYEDVIAPAIQDAGLEPYRVDQDPKVSIPIKEIETGIRESRLCLADISLDNPNVWFELGFAIASIKEVVLVCSDQRQSKFPFDVQHRSIIRYSTGAPRDFEVLRNSITMRIKALLQKSETLSAVTDISATRKFEGLEQHEVVTLAAIGENIDSIDDIATVYQIRRDMEQYGFTKLATTMALKTLQDKGFIKAGFFEDTDGDRMTAYSLSREGWEWILANKNQFVLQREKKGKDEIPF
ncbi:MAG: hypothetical protein AABZ67_02560 [Pseudomonadota bacterium]